MSLYTIDNTHKRPSFIENLVIEESADISLLSWLGTTKKQEVMRRLANDNLAFIAFWKTQPAAFGWMARGKAGIGEMNHEFILPERHRYLWNFRTLQDHRGKGIYPALLQFILQYEESRADRFWIIHAPENEASLKGIVKAGFENVGTLYLNEKGKVSIDHSIAAGSYLEYLQYMDIEVSERQPASCWNCSSPYLKNRKAECCCSERGKACVGPALSLAV